MSILLVRDGLIVPAFTPDFNNQEITIGIDSSKTDTGIVIGTPGGRLLHDYQIRAGGADNYIYDVCRYTRLQMRALLEGARITGVGIENIITKKEHGAYSQGLSIHNSRYQITAVFDSFIMLFQDYFGIMPTLCNNGTWKAATIPKSYRKQNGEKWSMNYLRDIGHPLSRRTDDVTDAYCIWTYINSLIGHEDITYITEPNGMATPYDYSIFPVTKELPVNAHPYNLAFDATFDKKLLTVANHLQGRDFGYFNIKPKEIPIAEMATHICETYPEMVDLVKVVVQRVTNN